MAKKEKAQEQKQDELAITPMPEAEIQPAEEKVEEPKKEERPRPTLAQILRGIILAILRLIIIVAVIGGCGAAVLFGAPLIYEEYIRPVEENTFQLSDLEFRQSQNEIQITDLQTRLATLEAGQTPQSDSITNLDTRVQSLEGADVQRNESLVELTYQTDLIRAMELLSRARLFLYQSNFGLARSDVQTARDVLVELQSTAPASKQQDLSEAIFRLDLALQNLPDFPVAASDDLDIAWQILMDGYPVPLTATPTTVPTLPPIETPTLVPDIIATPTAIP